MLVIVLLALGRAAIADPGAQLEHLREHRFVGPGPADRKLAGRLANVRTIEAASDALGHVAVLGEASVGAACAHSGAIHQMMGGIPEHLVHMASHVGVKGDHLADGHEFLLLLVPNLWIGPLFRLSQSPAERKVPILFRGEM
jgi:hypothetical protein